MSFTHTINVSEYIGDSLFNLNNNFQALDDQLSMLYSSSSSIAAIKDDYQTIERSISSLFLQLDTQFASTICQLRMSLNAQQSTEFSVVSSNTLYIHPYNGNQVGLYNTNTHIWDVHDLSGVVSFDLSGLSQSVYDVCLYHDGTNFQCSFNPWIGNVIGGAFDAVNLRTTVDFITVHSIYNNQRFIGCVKIDNNGCAHWSSSRSDIWNKYNQVNLIACNTSVSATNTPANIDVLVGESCIVYFNALTVRASLYNTQLLQDTFNKVDGVITQYTTQVYSQNLNYYVPTSHYNEVHQTLTTGTYSYKLYASTPSLYSSNLPNILLDALTINLTY